MLDIILESWNLLGKICIGIVVGVLGLGILLFGILWILGTIYWG